VRRNCSSGSKQALLGAGAAVSWESKKQSIVALNSTEAEYIALSTAAKEAVYIRKLVPEMGFGDVKTVQIYSDNQSWKCLVKYPRFHARSKHIFIKYHHVRDKYNDKNVNINYVPTEDMIADVLTKNLSRIKNNKCIKLMGLF